jgi:hypothetical protein
VKLRPTARKKNLVVQEMPDEVLVYDMESNKAHCLNQSAATVWRACNGKNTISDIVGEFEAKGRGKVSEDFVWLAIDQLGESSLLDGDIVAKFAGRSRRQVIKTVGLASMVAVPLVASLVAPQNALASVSCACTAGQPAPCNTRPACPSTTTCNASGQCAP